MGSSALSPSLERMMRAVSEIKYRYFALDKIYSELKLCASYQNQSIIENQSDQSKLFFSTGNSFEERFF